MNNNTHIKILSIGLALLMLLTPVSHAFASPMNPNDSLNIITVPIDADSLNEPQAAGAVLFFAGIVVGWVLDGVITYATGYSAAFWVAKGFTDMHNKIRRFSKGIFSGKVEVTSGGTICHNGFCRMPYSLDEEY